MQSLIAINTSAAWAEHASVFRNEREKPIWALEVADMPLQKDAGHVAALTSKVASHGELGDFELAHAVYKRAQSIGQPRTLLRAIGH